MLRFGFPVIQKHTLWMVIYEQWIGVLFPFSLVCTRN